MTDDAELLRQLIARIQGHATVAGASINLVVEGGARWDALQEERARHGQPPLPNSARRKAWEVSVWPDVTKPCSTQRGETLAEALKLALEVPFPAKL